MANDGKAVWFSVNGLIAAGKTTFIASVFPHLERMMGCNGAIVSEAVVKDSDAKGIPDQMLKLFYSDPKRWAYLFQTRCFKTRINEFVRVYEENKHHVGFFISDRDILADRNVFWETQYRLGNCNEIEYKE